MATNTCSFRCKFWLSDMFTHMGSNLEILGVPLVHCIWPSTCGDRVISVQLSQYHGCWCPGNVSPTFCELSNIIWRKYTMPARADPGFEVRGGANGTGLKWENYYIFPFFFLDLKLENYSVFTYLLFLGLKLENYSVFTFFDLRLENYSIFRWLSARLQ